MKKLSKLVLLSLLFSLAFASSTMAGDGSVLGNWKTIDDKTHQAKSIVNIYAKGGKYYGRVTRLFRKKGEDPNPLCAKCKGSRKDQPIQGMEVIWGLSQKGEEYSGGSILDPKNGKVYSCKLWLEGGQLKVRGYLGVFYRTQTWHRVK